MHSIHSIHCRNTNALLNKSLFLKIEAPLHATQRTRGAGLYQPPHHQEDAQLRAAEQLVKNASDPRLSQMTNQVIAAKRGELL